MKRTSKTGWIPFTLNLKASDPYQASIIEAIEALEDGDNGIGIQKIMLRLVVAGLGKAPAAAPGDVMRDEFVAMLDEFQQRITAQMHDLEIRLSGAVVSMRDSGEIHQQAAERLVTQISDSFSIDNVPQVAINVAKTTRKPGLRLEDLNKGDL